MEANISRYLDAAVLKPGMTRQEAIEAIQMAVDFHAKTVCVRPCDIDLAVGMCKDSDTGVSVVLAIPHGCTLSEVKSREAEAYIAKGVMEIDMVTNYGYIRSGLWDLVEYDIKCVTDIARPHGVPVKVIVESSILTLDEVAKATEVAIKANADFIKTSTGFSTGGATIEVVQTMLDVSKGRIQVKASGGIRDYAQAKRYVDMGATRLGAGYSSLAAICDNAPADLKTGY